MNKRQDEYKVTETEQYLAMAEWCQEGARPGWKKDVLSAPSVYNRWRYGQGRLHAIIQRYYYPEPHWKYWISNGIFQETEPEVCRTLQEVVRAAEAAYQLAVADRALRGSSANERKPVCEKI